MRSPVKGHNNSASLKALEDKLAEALVALKPFCLKKSWIRVPKKGSEIGVGGFGVVHRAVLQKWPFAPKVQVAVKKFHTNGEWEELLRVALVLVQELDVWAKLNHPNILPLNGFHLSSNLEEAWLVSPYATNGNLFEYLERTRLALDTRLELAKETAKGLEYLHTRMPPICHGDIKSLNVLIDSSGHAMLCDFGLTKATDTSTAATPRNDGGTIRYWSPELFDDDSYPTLNTDIWAWGCLLLEIITGLAPYHDVQLEGRLIHVISNKTLPAPLDSISCPPHIRDLLRTCWKIEPELRSTMTDLLGLLTAGNITFYRSQPLPPAPNVSSTAPLDHLERELEKLIGSLGRFRVDLSSFEFPKSGLAIGSGGFGVVHRATMRPNRRSSGVLVAVKKLRGLGGRDKRLRMVTALIREIAVWADLSHPLIIPFLGFYLSPQLEEAWLVAPLMTNGNLSQYVRSSKLRMDQRLMLALDTAKGLQYLHNHDPPVCHGDIKALNVLINSERRAVLCDFGLAKTMESMPSGLTTSTFKQAGSLAYESPELVCGKSLRGLESDVWAWGCLLQEVFSGQPPYHWANNSGVIVKWITQDIPPAVLQDVECTSHVRRLLRHCWQSRTDCRPSMDQCVIILADDLSLLLDSDDDRSEENALGVLQQLEDKLGGILIKDLAINRSHVDFTEASKIGSSSFGVLYKGQLSTEPSTSNNRVAVKLLSPSSNVSNVPDEVIQQIVSQLQEKHINILRITGYCRDPSLGGDLLLLFPYISAGSLDAYLTRKALDDTKKLVLATEIAEGLLYLHSRTPPISHGRLHPRNILINNMGRPLLSDFGFDKFAVHFKGVPATTESLRYQSPEVVAEASLGTLRGDAWSWGCVLLLIMSGYLPHHAVAEVDSLRQSARKRTYPFPLDDLDSSDTRTINLLGMCWTWDPLLRPTMSEIVAILTGKSFKFAESWSMGVEKLEGLRFSRDGKVLALRYPTSIKIHNIRTGDLEYELIVPNDKDEHGVMEFSRSGLLLAASSGPDVMVWDLATRQIREIQSFGNHGAWALDISSDDTFCAVGNEDGMVYLWDIRNKAKTRSASLKNKVYSVAISPGCEIVAVATSLAGVHIQDVPTLATLATFDVGTIWSVRFSPDGHRLFGDSADHIARCWNIVNIKEWGVNERVRVTSGLEFRGHGDNISSVSGNSTWFLSVSYGGEVRAVNLVTDAASGKTQRIGSMPPTYNNRWVDLSPVSEEGTGYAATYHGSGDMVIWKYASLSYRNAHCF